MPLNFQSYVEISALDAVRTRLADGDALVVLTPSLDTAIWANGAGAALFGHPDVGSIVGAEPGIGLAARRQIMSAPGYPKIGSDRAITVRLASGLTSRAVSLLASEIALPGGGDAILLAAPAPTASWLSPAETAGRAIAGLDRAGQQAAIVDAEGRPVVASAGFDGLGIGAEALQALVAKTGGGRVTSDALQGGRGRLPAALARLVDDPARYLLIVADAPLPDEAEDAVPAAETAQEGGIAGTGAIVDVVAAPSPEGEEPVRSDEHAAPAEAPAGQGAPAGEAAPPTVAPRPAVETAPAEAATAGAAPTGGEMPEEAAAVTEAASPESGPASPLDFGNSAPEAEEPSGNPPAEDITISDAAPQAADETAAAADDRADIAAIPVPADRQPAGPDGPAETASGETPVAPPEAPAPISEETVTMPDEAPAAMNEPDATAEPSRSTEPSAPVEASSIEAEPVPRIEVDRSAAPLRFVWKTDAEGRFSDISEDFVAIVGQPAADVVGLTFREAAARIGIDPSGEIAGLLERHDTWSGRSVLWPVAGTDLRIPVDLAALPTYDRDRNFAGFRGFGVARLADAIVDEQAGELALAGETGGPAAQEEPAAPAASAEGPSGPEGSAAPAMDSEATQEGVAADEGSARPMESGADAQASEQRPEDPFQGEVRALSIVPGQDRRFTDKVIRLAEHRLPVADKGLSPGERNAFREIGDRLKKDEDAPATSPGAPVLRADNDGKPKADKPATEKPAGHAAPASAAGKSAGSMQATLAEIARQISAKTGDQPQVAEPAGPAEAAQPAGEVAVPADIAAGPADGSGSPATGSPPEDGAGRAEDDDPAAPVMEAEASAGATVAADAPAAGQDDGAGEALAVEPQPTAEPLPVEQPAAESQAAAARPAATGDYLPSAFAPGREGRERTPLDTSILEQLPVPVLIHSGDVLHYANREFFEFTGYDSVERLSAAGGLGELFGEPYPPEGGEAEPGRKLRLRTAEGLEYPVEAFLQSVPWGEGKALLLSLRRSWRQPVSYPAAPANLVQAAAEPDLETRIAEMRAIVDTATDGVVLIARDGTIRSISRPAEALFGFDSKDVSGKPFTALFAIESQRAAHDYLTGLSDNGVASVLNDGREVIGREAQGRFIPLFMTIGRLPNDSGFCAVVRDITPWKRAEEELTQARAQAERASSQKTEFLARVSHEIRTPLNAIIGFSELMLDEKFGPIGNDRYKDYLRDINRSGNHVLDLVNDLLDISKIEAGQQEMSYEAVSLNDTLAETVAMMQPQANRERVIIRSSFASRLPDVVADLRSVRQIALNLLSNAIRYTPAGGQVIVSTAYESSGDVVMRVRDTGIGMSQAEMEQALKPFKQINALRRPRGDGTGLGLPLTKAMVEANRARFIINSTPGEGTLVEIIFPSTRVLAD
jgi:PAS domain S-box-containing protein